jgi:arginine N-succinyltransferase
MIIRSIQASDLPDLLHLAKQAGLGFTSLPPHAHDLKALIEASERSLDALATQNTNHPQPWVQGSVLLVLCHPQHHRVIGVCGLSCRAPSAMATHFKLNPWPQSGFGKRSQLFNHLSELQPTAYTTWHTHWMSLILDSAYRMPHAGTFLSRSRGLWLAQYGQAWPQTLSASLRGVSDSHGHAPFWSAVGAARLGISFTAAHHAMQRQDTQLASALLTQNIALKNLPFEAQAVIGQTHPHSLAALRLLRSDGFRYNGHVDMTDAGPHVISTMSGLRTVAETRALRLRIMDKKVTQNTPWMMLSFISKASPLICLVQADRHPTWPQDLLVDAHTAMHHRLIEGETMYACPLYTL